MRVWRKQIKEIIIIIIVVSSSNNIKLNHNSCSAYEECLI